MHIALVTFNTAEEAAVDQLLDDICLNPSHWNRHGRSAVLGPKASPTHLIDHHPLLAQGNVVAAIQLCRLFEHEAAPDAVIFYGCAGAVHAMDSLSVFIANLALYCSLGHVKVAGTAEVVQLKPKWITAQPGEPAPLPPMSLGLLATNAYFVPRISRAAVVATDKVVEVAKAASVPPLVPPPDSWSYAQALAHVDHTYGSTHGVPVIVDMESYGIAQAMAMKGLDEKVVVVRVTTDDLVSKNTEGAPNQEELLVEGRHALAEVIRALIA